MTDFLSLGLALRSLVLIAIAGAVVRVVFPRSRAGASARHLVWLCSLIGLLLLPFAARFARPLPLPIAAISVISLPTPSLTSAIPIKSGVPFEATIAPTVAASAGTAPRTHTVSDAAAPPLDSQAVLGLTWALGTLLLIIRLLVSVIIVGRRSKRDFAPAAPDSPAALASIQAGAALGIRPAAVRMAGRATGLPPVPLVFGAHRPVILLPAFAADWTMDRLGAVLRHESAHVRRGDWAWQLLAETAVALYWWNPLVWRAARNLRAESEECCDDLAIASGVRPSEYAAHLVGIAAALQKSPGRSYGPVIVTMAQQPEISRRIEAALQLNRNRRSLSRAAAFCVAAVALTLLFALAALRQGYRAEAAERVSSDRPSAFPGGEKIEVTGIAYGGSAESEAGWWSADGAILPARQPLPPGIWQGAGDPKRGMIGRVLKLRLTGIPEDAHAVFGVSDAPEFVRGIGEVSGSPYDSASRSRMYRVHTGSVGINATTALEVALAMGPWKSVHDWLPTDTPPTKALTLGAMSGVSPLTITTDSAGRRVYQQTSLESFRLRYRRPVQVRRDLLLPLMTNGPKLNWRVAALLKNGSSVSSSDINASRKGDQGSSQPVVIAGKVLFPNVRLADVARFEFQVRPYQYVELRNIALYPRQKG